MLYNHTHIRCITHRIWVLYSKAIQHSIVYINKYVWKIVNKSLFFGENQVEKQRNKRTNLIKSNINLSYLTFGNLTPMIASSGFDRKQFVISFVTSLFNRLFPFVSKWHAICWDTSTRILSGSGIIDHGLNADPLSNIARWIRAGNGFYYSFSFYNVIEANQIIFYCKIFIEREMLYKN